MARYTRAYSDFLGQTQEVQELLARASTLERYNPIQNHNGIEALCRGAIVLLSARLEGYVKQLGELTLHNIHSKGVSRQKLAKQFFYHISKDLIDEIQDTADPGKIAVKVFGLMQQDVHYWSLVGAFPQPLPIDRFNKGFANPKVDKISSYFNRFGYADHKRDLARELRADYNPTINMVDHMVDLRNKIAHGDTLATKPPADLKVMLGSLRLYCRATDNTFSSWCKATLCSIR